jgi:hypothetical protein
MKMLIEPLDAPSGTHAMTPTPATPPLVIWTLAAHRKLRQALTRPICRLQPDIFTTTMTDLTKRLQYLFPDAAAIVVQDQFVGFRQRDDQFILLVEVTGVGRCGRHIVKLAPEKLLHREVSAWESCRPYGLSNDLVLMPLEARYQGTKIVGLVYGDAQQFLGVPTTTSLESAVLGAVAHGAPSPSSVAQVLRQLFERIGFLLYPNSCVQDPAGNFACEIPKIRESMNLWQEEDTDAGRSRRDINTWAQSGRGQFRDPIDYLRFLDEVLPKEQTPPAEKPAVVTGGTTAARWLPRVLIGCAHGDLHGRNVLVGMVRNRALWPAVYDYEHMGPCNLLAWDFVKMETELKIRAFPVIFHGGELPQFVRSVQAFEIGLAERTEDCHRRSNWPEVADASERQDRLRSLLLTVRHQAAVHLGEDRGRPREWLDEYYLLLACYGISVVRFENLMPRERIAAYVSAGVALARFLWTREAGKDVRTTATTAADAMQQWYPSYHTQMEIGREWARAGQPKVAESVLLLEQLRQRYPHIVALGHELVFALLQENKRDEAFDVLNQLAGRFPEPDEETLCRWGRWYKEAGDAVFDANPAQAELDYLKARDFYDRAYVLRQGHYPGINRAALQVLQAAASRKLGRHEESRERLAEAEELARALLQRRGVWPHDQSDDNIWHAATAGEAYLLMREWPQAAAAYQEALRQPNLRPMHRESMRAQVRRILTALARLGLKPEPPFDDVNTLFPLPDTGGPPSPAAQ